jgi:heme exporter protein CcmD
MGDYTLFITATYGISGVALLILGLASYRKMKASEREAQALRRKRKEQN